SADENAKCSAGPDFGVRSPARRGAVALRYVWTATHIAWRVARSGRAARNTSGWGAVGRLGLADDRQVELDGAWRRQEDVAADVGSVLFYQRPGQRRLPRVVDPTAVADCGVAVERALDDDSRGARLGGHARAVASRGRVRSKTALVDRQ